MKKNHKFKIRKWRTILISTICVLIVTAIAVYFNNKKRLLAEYSSRNLELHKIRTELEKRGQKEIAYDQCVVDHSFIVLWFPWTFQQINEEVKEKIRVCEDRLDMKDNSRGL